MDTRSSPVHPFHASSTTSTASISVPAAGAGDVRQWDVNWDKKVERRKEQEDMQEKARLQRMAELKMVGVALGWWGGNSGELWESGQLMESGLGELKAHRGGFIATRRVILSSTSETKRR